MLEQHLEIVRTQGYAIDDEEYNVGVRCVAVPVYDDRASCVAAIGISGPTSRLTLEKIPETAQTVVATGKELSALLGFSEHRS